MHKNILFVHKGSELYGSDKTLLYLVKGVKASNLYTPIVILQSEGNLKDEIDKHGIETIVLPFTKIERADFKPTKILKLPFKLLKSLKMLEKALGGRSVHLVHSNTLSVVLGLFYAKKNNIRHFWHVHENIHKPNVIRKAYTFLLTKGTDKVIYNSQATAEFWNTNKRLKNKASVILNGFDRKVPFTQQSEIEKLRTTFFKASENTQVIGLIGRLNNWKGQGLLLDAYNLIKEEFPDAILVFIGSVYKGQEKIKDDLLAKIAEYNLQDKALIVPFQEEIWKFWDGIDIAIVPSLEPEPFGLVAIEAMLSKKPLVAAKHGGLKEIIVDNNTGLFFEPKNTKDLANKLREILSDEDKIKTFGENGYLLAQEKFSLKNYVSEFIEIYR